MPYKYFDLKKKDKNIKKIENISSFSFEFLNSIDSTAKSNSVVMGGTNNIPDSVKSTILSRYFVNLFNSNVPVYFLTQFCTFAHSSISLSKYTYLSLVLRVTLNNIFLTLINNNGEVLLSLSGGRVGLKGFSRRSVNALKLMLKKLILYVKKNRLENKLLFFIVKTNWLSLKRIVLTDMFAEGVEFNFIIFDIKRCHNGLRKRKLRNR